MKKNSILLIIIMLFTFSYTYGQVTSHSERKLAIYLPEPNGDVNYPANLSSVKQIGDVTGLPYIISSSFFECLSYGVVLFATPVEEMSLTSSQEELLMTYVENGGSVIFSGLEDDDLLEFSGVESVNISRSRYYLNFVSPFEKKELRWINDEKEHQIKLGSPSYGDIILSYGYSVSEGEMLAEYRSGNAGLVKMIRGDGIVYTFGLLWRDMIVRNNLDRDFQANREYSNYFEATSDVIMLLVRGMFAEAVPNSVWISPAPYDSKAVLMITHDVCSHTAQIFANDFAQMELDRGISATYNITTHKFKDDINGDNYTSHIAQMQSLVNKNHVIGSHSYGHFPDFDIPDIFPVGERITSISNYNPYYSLEKKRTIGGTVYGEIGVSKMLLEKDLNTNVIMHRSGHLYVNPYQYNVLDELGFLYSSSYTQGDILTGFPFYAHYDRAMNGEELAILEMGLAISDVFGSYHDPIDEFNWQDKARLWLEVTEKYADNNSFTNILVHPNRSYKLDALVYLLDNMSKDIYPMELTKYGEFWKEKNTVDFSSFKDGDIMKIYINDIGLGNEEFSFILDSPNGINTVEIYNTDGELQDFTQKDYYLGTALLYQKSFVEVQEKSASLFNKEEVLSQNYPNPFTYYTTIEYLVPENAFVSLQVFDIYGRLVSEEVNTQQIAGKYKIEFDANKLSKGLYFYQIQLQTESLHTLVTKKMIIK